MTRSKTLLMVRIAMMSVIIAVCSWVTIPFAVPFTLQTFGVFLALKVLGGRYGTISIVIYILLGIVGMPVFSNFNAGIGHIAGPTGGYIVGFTLSGLVYWFLEKHVENGIHDIAIMLVSLLPCYLLGTAWFAFVYGTHGKAVGLLKILSMCVLPFIIPDAFKISLADLVGKRVKKIQVSYI